MTDRAVIDTTNETSGPSLQESHDALVEEGVIKGEGTEATTPENTQGETEGSSEERPEWLPSKFKSPEELAKAYAELERKQSKGKAQDDPADDKAGTSDSDDKAAEEVVESAGLDMTALQDEYDRTGKLSDASYEALEKVGITKSMVDAYIEGLNAQADLYGREVRSIAGGEAEYEAMIEWASANLSEDEIEAYDEAVNSYDIKKAKAAVAGLHARMQLAEGAPPERRVDGRGTSSDVYETQAQIEADMNDPRYASDEAFRQRVYAKMARSNL